MDQLTINLKQYLKVAGLFCTDMQNWPKTKLTSIAIAKLYKLKLKTICQRKQAILSLYRSVTKSFVSRFMLKTEVGLGGNSKYCQN